MDENNQRQNYDSQESDDTTNQHNTPLIKNNKNSGFLVTDFEPESRTLNSVMCCECEDDVAHWRCKQCTDLFCRMCYNIQHRSGKRRLHVPQTLLEWKESRNTNHTEQSVNTIEKPNSPISSLPEKYAKKKLRSVHMNKKTRNEKEINRKQTMVRVSNKINKMNKHNDRNKGRKDVCWKKFYGYIAPVFGGVVGMGSKLIGYSPNTSFQDNISQKQNDWWGGCQQWPNGHWFLERSKHIPLRLPLEQRKYMRLVLAAMQVCPDPPHDLIAGSQDRYSVPFPSRREKIAKNRVRAIFQQLRNISGVLLGMAIATNFSTAQDILNEESELKDHDEFFQALFELCRRHKIRNPEKMRSEYGKLIYFLQDCLREGIRNELGFNPVKPVDNVHSFFSERNALKILHDQKMPIATGEILAENRSRRTIDRSIRKKEKAISYLATKYQSHQISEEEIRQCILSIGDNHNYLRFNRDPCDVMLMYLKIKFNPNNIQDPRYSLAIEEGLDGSRLTHSHYKQYEYVLQTLTLWRNIIHNMYKLWMLSEEDLLDPKNQYTLKNTGQGIQRIQQAPRVWKCMRRILYQTQQQLEADKHPWVGSSVIHLGDENVPNALMFIDKYNQVPRILLPIVTCLRLLPNISERNDMEYYINHHFGGIEGARMAILSDFFRLAFDGSGADNFNNAGSCIDGRLTSAWHWGETLHYKDFYSLFQLTGFTGFDGKF